VRLDGAGPVWDDRRVWICPPGGFGAVWCGVLRIRLIAFFEGSAPHPKSPRVVTAAAYLLRDPKEEKFEDNTRRGKGSADNLLLAGALERLASLISGCIFFFSLSHQAVLAA
jgi:hypothetical protein